MDLEIISEIRDIEIIAVADSIHDLPRLKKQYGLGRWRKLKGIAQSDSEVDEFASLRSIGTRRTELENDRKRYLD